MILAPSFEDLSLWWTGFIAMDCVEVKPCGRSRKMLTVWQPEKKKRGKEKVWEEQSVQEQDIPFKSLASVACVHPQGSTTP